MASYNEQLESQLTGASTTKITAVPLDISENHPMRMKGYYPIMPSCVCVTEPCPCDDEDGPIVWIRDDDVRKRVETKRENKAGQSLVEYYLDRGASVITETFALTTVSALGGRSEKRVPTPPFRNGGSYTRSGSYYDGQGCYGGTLYDVWVEADGVSTNYHYIAVGSCVV